MSVNFHTLKKTQQKNLLKEIFYLNNFWDCWLCNGNFYSVNLTLLNDLISYSVSQDIVGESSAFVIPAAGLYFNMTWCSARMDIQPLVLNLKNDEDFKKRNRFLLTVHHKLIEESITQITVKQTSMKQQHNSWTKVEN